MGYIKKVKYSVLRISLKLC